MPSFRFPASDQFPKVWEPWKVIKIGETIEPADFVDFCLFPFGHDIINQTNVMLET